MVKAVFLDFYGTVVHEDDDVIRKIIKKISDTGNAKCRSEIGSYWQEEFQRAVYSAYGKNFQTQRELEYCSLKKTIDRFGSSAEAKELSQAIFEHWRKPPIFEDAKCFLECCPTDIYLVSNIDRDDIMAAVEFHGLKPAGIFTSEDAKAYKPRRELFELALNQSGLSAEQVVHIGDSLSSDIQGASSVGIRAIWINRNGKETPIGVSSIQSFSEFMDADFQGNQ